ncbi:SDR family oxidoreductase [Bifidobacterium longum]|uniref:SDR family oxidoreductase n=1 Tax=Bifidobacterium longum TaxID=216816 RepID=UPI0009BBE5BF|nr:SDR family NAD(P)-dependent oxidoreductase [Bifidobacterium longum]
MLAGRHIVITGGGSGIGLAMARKFVSQGASVLIAGRNKEKLEKAVSSLGGNAQYLVFDVSKVEMIVILLYGRNQSWEASTAWFAMRAFHCMKVTSDM